MIVVALKGWLVRGFHAAVIAVAPCPVGSRIDVRAVLNGAWTKRTGRYAAAVGVLAKAKWTDPGREPDTLPWRWSSDKARREPGSERFCTGVSKF